MAYVKNLQNKEKQQKNKVFDVLFKYTLLLITLFVVFLIVASFITIITRGINEVGDSNSTWTQILFGKEFDMTGKLAMGIIVINTIWMSLLVLIVTTPISVCTALFITKILKEKTRIVMLAVISILAAIPSVIYGTFGKYFLLKFLYSLGITVNSTEATLLSVVIIVSIMVMPTITLMSTTSLMMVDKKMEDSSEALGATKMQTSIFVTLKSAKSGIIIGMLFALGRCLGEATAISMLSGARPMADGVTFNLLEVSLFMSPVIMSSFVGSSLYPSSKFTYIVLSALLLMVVILLFLFVKFVETKMDDDANSVKHSKKAVAISEIIKKVEREGQNSLTNSEANTYSQYLRKQNDSYYYANTAYSVRSRETSLVMSRTSLDESKKFSSFKKNKSILYMLVIFLMSLFGILFLASILSFLFHGDLSLLFNWDYLTMRGKSGDYYGLGMAMFGTFITVLIVLAIALPIGILIAVYTNSFLNSNSRISKIFSFCFQIMTSIPAVIYGSLATIIFVEGGFVKTNALSLIPIIMLVMVVLPTIIRQTQEGFRNVKKSQVEGSLALGSTTTHTSMRIVITQSLPAILSAAILAISIVMADSAIMITIIGHPGTPSTSKLWMQNGGYTLSTMIYWLSADASAAVINRQAAVEQMKIIGILLMIMIFWLTIISQKIKNKNNLDSLIMFIGLVLFATSFYIFNGVIILCYLGIVLGILGLFVNSIVSRIKR